MADFLCKHVGDSTATCGGGEITHRPAIDWLTLTTSDFCTSQNVARWINTAGLTPLRKEAAGGQGYVGNIGDGWFIGMAEKNGKDSHMLRLSGSLSDWFMFQEGRPANLECTRIDIQLTLPTPYKGNELYSLSRNLVDELYEREKSRGQRARGIDPIVPPDGEFTIYLGDRGKKSGRFIRFYVKPQESGDWLLRFEVEFKNKSGLAGKVYRAVGKEPARMVKIISGELLSWPPNNPLIAPFVEHMTAVPADIMRLERRRPTSNSTLLWLAKQVMPAWKRLLGQHDTCDRAELLLHELVLYASSLDV